ncbi:hypothetical protein P43SY_008905 [Pythium insidiosum]|uniref:Inhibitor of growth protein n=1 Tax=Pythium insidiosum TaxID=114742 RepID=A0AAD5LFX5_PYTIN|nr:hypothetical protein P43SY_008905 [Pythium insidiosum]
MGTYLEDFLESMYMLPSEIKRNFDLMRELDKTSHPLMDELKTFHREHLVSARKRVVECCSQRAAEGAAEPDDSELRALVETDETLDKLKEKHQRVVQKLDEKIAIAAQCYDLVDHHIRRLDQDLEAYAALLKANGEFEDDKTHVKKRKLSSQTSAADGSSAAGASDAAIKTESGSGSGRQSAGDRGRGAMGGSGGGGASGSAAAAAVAAAAAAAQQQLSSAQASGSSRKAAASGSTTGRKRSAAAAAAAAAAATVAPVVETAFAVGTEDLPIDPNEPVYCHCRRVSYGQMVGCDNDDCKYEWFHFECVGLTDQPQGTWYCSDCKAALGIK